MSTTTVASPAALARRYVPLTTLAIVFVSPLLFMLVTSFKTRQESSAIPPSWIPDNPTTEAYSSILNASGTPVLQWFTNSMIAATAHAALVVATAALAAYPLARMEFRGKKVVFAMIVATLFVPPVILVIPNYLIVGELKWLDTLVAVIVPTAAGAFGVFFLRQFFLSLPQELEEAARIDGATRVQTMLKIILPLCTPGFISAGIFAFTLAQNEFLYALIFLTSSDVRTVPVGAISELIRGDVFYWGQLMAAALLGSIPVAIIYSFFVEHYVSGLTAGAVKQ